jgi:ankyrin repeat protein
MSTGIYFLIMLVIIGVMVGLIIHFLKKKGTETLFNACQDGDLRKAKSLIRNDPGLIDVYDPSGSTPLLVSVENGHLNIAEILIYRGANVNMSGNLGVTPLHLAAERGFTDMVKLLVQKGAMVKAKDEMGASPLHYAVEKGKAEIVQILLEKGSDPAEVDNSGDSSLKIAVAKGRRDIIDMLKAQVSKE